MMHRGKLAFTVATLFLLSGCCMFDFSHRKGKSLPEEATTSPKLSTAAAAPVEKNSRAAEVAKDIFNGLTIYFKTGSSEVTQESNERLDAIGAWLKSNSDKSVVVEGHVDASGSPKSNISLAQRRADGVRSLLLAKGGKSGQVEAVGMGKTPTERKAVVRAK